MNLVQDCIQVISGKPLSYFKESQKSFILALFQKCLRNPALAGYRKDLNQINEHLEAFNGPLNLWRDCEPYFPIDCLARVRGVEFVPYLIEVLKIYIGMKDIEADGNLPDGFYRLTNLRGTTFEIRERRLRRVPTNIVWKASSFEPKIFLPMNGLFNDILEEDAYPRMRSPYDIAATKSHIEGVILHMREFSRDVWEDFQDAVWNLVLTTGSKRRGISSMSMPCRYFGGIFYNAFLNDEYRAVEQLMHEYVHQRCALWWETLRPTGIPTDEIFIVSPVTGDQIHASYMIHAFIIYLSAIQFYRFVQSTKAPSDRAAASRLNRRALHLRRNMPALYARLNRVVKRNTDMKRLLGYLMEVFEPLKHDL